LSVGQMKSKRLYGFSVKLTTRWFPQCNGEYKLNMAEHFLPKSRNLPFFCLINKGQGQSFKKRFRATTKWIWR
jgi:hypothetical protein